MNEEQAPARAGSENNEGLQRNDFRTVLDLVEPGSRVLDLGCGDGTLLQLLRARKQASGYGVEMDQRLIMECIARGLSVFQGNLDEGLRDFEDQGPVLHFNFQGIQHLRQMLCLEFDVDAGAHDLDDFTE